MIGYPNTRRRLVLVCFLAATTVASVAAQAPDPSEPPWLLVARGDAALSDRDAGAALRFYRAALAQSPTLPEAELGIARVYRADGNFTLALRHYERAAAQARNFAVPADEVSLRYEQASLLLDLGQPQDARIHLQAIIDRSDEWTSPESLVRQGLPLSAVLRGAERALELFRLTDAESGEAHTILAGLLDQPGASGQELREAFDHASFAFFQSMSALVEAVISRNPPFEFRDFAGLFAELSRLRLTELPRQLAVFPRAINLAEHARSLSRFPETFGDAVPANPGIGPGAAQRLQLLAVELLDLVLAHDSNPINRRIAEDLLGDA